MRVAIYGGSFNPPHVGHAMVAAWLKWTDRCDQVWVLPAYSHAFGKTLAPFADRVSWCRALAQDVGPWLQVCTVESELPAPSFTVDTLNVLADRHPDHHFRLVIGSDCVPHTPKWKDWEGIQRRYHPIIVGRQGYPASEGAISFPDVSSTEIRNRLSTGQPLDYLVPASVLALLDASFFTESASPVD